MHGQGGRVRYPRASQTKLRDVRRVPVRSAIAEEECSSVDRDEIERVLAGAAELKLEGRVVPLLQARLAGISAVPTLADKLRRWAELTCVDGEPLAERLAWLQATPADEIVRTILSDMDMAALAGSSMQAPLAPTSPTRGEIMADLFRG